MIYDYLISNYAHQENYRYNTSVHKKNELKQIYNKIVKLSKDSPSYIVKPSPQTKSFALQLKEGSLTLQDTLSKLQNGGLASAFSYKEVSCDNKQALSTNIDTNDHSNLPEPFTLQIHQLASKQINSSAYFYRTTNKLKEGNYSFAINIEEEEHIFNLELTGKTSNEEVLYGICKSINQSPAEVTASTGYDKSGEKLRLSIFSDHTGTPDGEAIFTCRDLEHPKGSPGLVEFYGFDAIKQMPHNSSFEINGTPQSTLANEFTLNNSLHLKMHAISEEPIHVTYTGDSNRVLSEISSISDTYNSLVKLSYEQGEPPHLATLMFHDLQKIFSDAAPALRNCGVTFDEEGYMQIDTVSAKAAAMSGAFEKIFGEDTEPGKKAIDRSTIFSLDPLKYFEDKIMVTYPCPTKEHFANPYMTSIYSGLLLDSYC